MRKITIRLLLYFYLNYKRSNLLRNLIKRIIGGHKIEIMFNDFIVQAGIKTALELNVIFNSYNEVVVLEIIKIFSLKGYNFIDIGANIGLHSLTAAAANSNIEIYSFEPEPYNYQDLIKNIILNQYYNIRPFKMGLGDFTINKYLNINESWNKGKHSLKHTFERSFKKINIPLSKLDSFKENIKSDTLIIKIDVEGYEKEVLEGAKLVFNETKNIVLIIELIEENNEFSICKEITSILKELGFQNIYKVNSNNDLLIVSDFEDSADYIFIKGSEGNNIIEDYFRFL